MVYDALDFSKQRFRAMLRLSLAQGYKPIFFGEENQTERFIIWRHDVDLELPAVLKMARIEAEEGIRSTYFLTTGSLFYNLFTSEGEKVVKELLELGHQIGLHCNLGVDRNEEVTDEFITAKVEQDFTLVSAFYGKNSFQPIVSFHNPPKGVLKKYFPSFYSTYSEPFFCEIKYLSDSNRVWREGPPEEWLCNSGLSKFSILLHPIIWAYPGETMRELVKEYLNQRYSDFRAWLIADDIKV